MNALTEFAISGLLVLAALLSLAAGAVSFASPCCIPLVPGYLAYLSGLAGTGGVGTDRAPFVPERVRAPGSGGVGAAVRFGGRTRLVWAALLFVAGFTAVFTAAVMTVLGLSDLLVRNEAVLQRVGGVVTILMGLVFLGLVPALHREVRFHFRPRGGLWGAPLLGAVFGLGWTPCLGPTLAGVIALAAGTQVGPATARGLLLMLAYGLGLGLPFLLLALGLDRAVRATGWVRRRSRGIQVVGGVMLLVIGVLLVTGLWGAFIAWLRAPIGGFTTLL